MQQMPFPPQAPQVPPDPQLGHVVAEWRAGMGRRIWTSAVVLISGGLIAVACFANDSAVLGGIFAVLTLLHRFGPARTRAGGDYPARYGQILAADSRANGAKLGRVAAANRALIRARSS